MISFLISCSYLFGSPDKMLAQTRCDDYSDILDSRITQLFTSESSRISREHAFPPIVHHVSETQIRHLQLPSEQWICDGVIKSIYENDPAKKPPTHYALYRVKDHYFMIIYRYITASDGTHYFEEPTFGVLYDPQFNRVGVIGGI